MKRKGFTLIELLVVISIITLLVSIILPSLGKARMYSKRVVCMTRLKGIGTAWLMYLDGGKNDPPQAVSLPADKTEGDPPADEVTIMDAFSKEVETPEAWHCPGDDQSYFENHGTSYEYFLGLFMPIFKALEDDPEAYKAVVKMRDMMVAEYGDRMTVLHDADAFHPSSKNPLGRMCLYYDGHVDTYVEVDIPPELEEMVK